MLAALAAAMLACGEPSPPPQRDSVSNPPGSSSEARAVERIVLVTIDTLRADHVGCYGDELAETPTLDGIASRGLRFSQAISPAPITLPTHATLLTGLDPPEHGVRHNGLFRLAPEIPTLASHLKAQGFATAAFVSAFVLDSRYGLARGFESYDDELGLDARGHTLSVVTARRADETTDAVLAWLATAPARFFLWVHYYDPHGDYTPPIEYLRRFRGRPYDGEIAFTDAELGRLLRGLHQRFDPGGTLLAVTSDHGESLGEHGESTHAMSIYDATQRVPLLLEGAGIEPGSVDDEIAPLSFVAPTLLALAKLPPLPGASGSNLLAASPAPRSAWVETLATELDMAWSPLLGVRTRTHKYIRAPRPELYEIASDPDELVNRAADEPELLARLDGWVEEHSKGVQRVELKDDMSSEERARLEALGYLVGKGSKGEVTIGRVGGFDPKQGLPMMGDLQDAINAIARRRGEEALKLLAPFDEKSRLAVNLRTKAALLTGDLDLARRYARHAIATNPGADSWVDLGRVEEADGRIAEATSAYETALEDDPGDAAARVGLGRLAERSGALAEATAYYRDAAQQTIPVSEAIWRLAALEMEADRESEARVLWTSLPSRALRFPPAAARLARAERATGRADKALGRVRASRRFYPDDAELAALERELQAEQDAAQETTGAAP